MQTAWFSVVLAGACVAAGLFHLARTFLLRGGGAFGEVSQATMCLGMAAMFVPVADPLPRTAWLVTLLVIGAWFTACALRSATGAGEPGHHAVCALAMIFMLFTHGAATAGAPDGGHAHHGGAVAAGAGPSTLLLTGASLLLAAYFVAHTIRDFTGGPGAAPVATGSGAVAVRIRRRTGAMVPAAHAVMGGAMTVMLLGAVA